MQNVYEVFSLQEARVFRLKYNEKKSIKEISKLLNCSPNTIKEYCKRIKKKITDLRLIKNLVLVYEPEPGNEIDDIFNEEKARTLPKKTINQVQFLSESNKMSCKKRSPAAVRQMRRQTDTSQKVTRRILSDAERAKLKIVPTAQIPDTSVTSAYIQYCSLFNNPPDIESMAVLEIVLRAHGLIFRTPFINKLNRKTSRTMRAQETGYQTVIINSNEDTVIPPGSKFVETIKDEKGCHECSIWLFPKAFCYLKNKQKS